MAVLLVPQLSSQGNPRSAVRADAPSPVRMPRSAMRSRPSCPNLAALSNRPRRRHRHRPRTAPPHHMCWPELTSHKPDVASPGPANSFCQTDPAVVPGCLACYCRNDRSRLPSRSQPRHANRHRSPDEGNWLLGVGLARITCVISAPAATASAVLPATRVAARTVAVCAKRPPSPTLVIRRCAHSVVELPGIPRRARGANSRHRPAPPCAIIGDHEDISVRGVRRVHRPSADGQCTGGVH